MLTIQPVKTVQTNKVVFGVIWNLIIAGAICFLIINWRKHPNYLAAGLLSIFAIPGILILLSILQAIVVMFGPQLQMKVHGYRLGPGERIELSWTLSKANRLRGIQIWLKQGLNFANVYESYENSIQPYGMASVEIPTGKPTNEPVVIHIIGYVKYFPKLRKSYTVLKS